MGFDWEETLDADGDELADAYEASVADASEQSDRDSSAANATTSGRDKDLIDRREESD